MLKERFLGLANPPPDDPIEFIAVALYTWGQIARRYDVSSPSVTERMKMVSSFLDSITEQCGTPYEIIINYDNGEKVHFHNVYANVGKIVTGEVGHA